MPSDPVWGEALFCGIVFGLGLITALVILALRAGGKNRANPDHPSGYDPFTSYNPDDITTYRSTKEIFNSNHFSPAQRRQEYIRRGKSPSGVVDGEYNDTYLEDGEIYDDTDRDWDADA